MVGKCFDSNFGKYQAECLTIARVGPLTAGLDANVSKPCRGFCSLLNEHDGSSTYRARVCECALPVRRKQQLRSALHILLANSVKVKLSCLGVHDIISPVVLGGGGGGSFRIKLKAQGEVHES